MNNKPMSDRDKQVEVRNSILSLLYKGCNELNRGYREFLSNTLQTIHNHTFGFSVDMKSDYVFEAFHERHTKDDNMIAIMEGDKELLVIVKLKSGQCKGEWRVYEVDEYDFLDDAYIRAEAQAEQDAETAYERYYDYKASMDDPRGY